ncbi:MAG TPA: hypothetical protein VH110_04240 [Candidatus Acidoferrum sp.]|jgi:hypothetical protein|nr:hypothetical protein [Candidatus Acidoferrum sp.]
MAASVSAVAPASELAMAILPAASARVPNAAGLLAERIGAFTGTQAVGEVESAVMISAQAHAGRWVEVRCFFRSKFIQRSGCE